MQDPISLLFVAATNCSEYSIPLALLTPQTRAKECSGYQRGFSACSSEGFIFIFYLTGVPSSLQDTSFLFGRTSRLDWNMRKLAEMDHPGRGRKRA